MIENFDKAFIAVIGFEGTVSEQVTGDKGGLTKFGISQRSYPNLDIANLTLDDAKKIYQRDYWQAMHCDALDWPLDLVVFDSSVNCGVGQARKWLDITTNWQMYLFMRMKFYADISGDGANIKFIRGWLNRTYKLARIAQGWASA